MAKVVVSSPKAGGRNTGILLKESFRKVGAEILCGDYTEMMGDIPGDELIRLNSTPSGREILFAHAKKKAIEVLEDADVLVLPGNAAMVAPEHFHEKRNPNERYDFFRTIAELAMIHVAVENKMPILGVCAGSNVLAVYFGGKLDYLTESQLNQQGYMEYSDIHFNEGSMLAQILKGQTDPSVLKKSDQKLNALDTSYYTRQFYGSHKQVVTQVGAGLRAVAFANDNKQSMEALESESGAPIIGIQFHPEVDVMQKDIHWTHFESSPEKREQSLNIFRFFDNAGNIYRKHKNNDMSTKEQVMIMEDKKISASPSRNILFFSKMEKNSSPVDILRLVPAKLWNEDQLIACPMNYRKMS